MCLKGVGIVTVSLIEMGWVVNDGLNGLGPFQLLELAYSFVYIKPNSLIVYVSLIIVVLCTK
jgi:hypothetical protein